MGDNIGRAAGGVIGSTLSAIGMTLSINEIQAIVSIIFTILGFLITLFTTIIIPVIKKVKKAKEDGKITVDELEDIIDTAADGLEKTKKEIEKDE